MDAIKAKLPRAVALGYYLFLESEKERHLEDVSMILNRQQAIMVKYEITESERLDLIEKSKDFVVIE